jgi:hypothetical protein
METYCGKPSSLVWSKDEAETIHPYDAIPLYTHPTKTLTDEEILQVAENSFTARDGKKPLIEFARAILRKAQGD